MNVTNATLEELQDYQQFLFSQSKNVENPIPNRVCSICNKVYDVVIFSLKCKTVHEKIEELSNQ
jgi:hypothetical protein